jgi:hypothetical protein
MHDFHVYLQLLSSRLKIVLADIQSKQMHQYLRARPAPLPLDDFPLAVDFVFFQLLP